MDISKWLHIHSCQPVHYFSFVSTMSLHDISAHSSEQIPFFYYLSMERCWSAFQLPYPWVLIHSCPSHWLAVTKGSQSMLFLSCYFTHRRLFVFIIRLIQRFPALFLHNVREIIKASLKLLKCLLTVCTCSLRIVCRKVIIILHFGDNLGWISNANF